MSPVEDVEDVEGFNSRVKKNQVGKKEAKGEWREETTDFEGGLESTLMATLSGKNALIEVNNEVQEVNVINDHDDDNDDDDDESMVDEAAFRDVEDEMLPIANPNPNPNPNPNVEDEMLPIAGQGEEISESRNNRKVERVEAHGASSSIRIVTTRDGVEAGRKVEEDMLPHENEGMISESRNNRKVEEETLPQERAQGTAQEHMNKRLLKPAEAATEVSVPRCKLVLLGQECVGKSNLVRRLTGQSFEPRWISTQGGEQCMLDQRSWQLFQPGSSKGSFRQKGEDVDELCEALARSMVAVQAQAAKARAKGVQRSSQSSQGRSREEDKVHVRDVAQDDDDDEDDEEDEEGHSTAVIDEQEVHAVSSMKLSTLD